jgi:hypothetical protein
MIKNEEAFLFSTHYSIYPSFHYSILIILLNCGMSSKSVSIDKIFALPEKHPP